jgi:hypothetical protein
MPNEALYVNPGNETFVTTLKPKGASFSGYYTYSNPLRQRLTAQFKPKDIFGDIEVAIGDIATMRANVT